MEKKYSGKRIRQIFFLCITFFICVLYIKPELLYADNKKQVIRVGYPIQKGMTDKDQNGNYFGYTYEYLLELAQYLGWNYEIVEIPGEDNEALLQSYEMLKNGEIDLLGGTKYNESLAEIYEYPDIGYGVASDVLCVLFDNVSINETNYMSVEHLKIGLLKSSEKQKEELDNMCAVNNMTPEYYYYETGDELCDALRKKEVDTILLVDVGIEEDMRVIAKFTVIPFYFAAKKGDTHIIQQISEGIHKINETTPSFALELYEKYFGARRRKVVFQLSDSENEFIKQSGIIKVALTSNRAPFQYYDEKSGKSKGMNIDFIHYVSDLTGLRFEFIVKNNQNELQTALNQGTVDMVAGIIRDYDLAEKYHVSLSHGLFSSPITMAFNHQIDPSNLSQKKLSLPHNFSYNDANDSEIVYFDTLSECLDAVNRGMADYCVGNGYAMQYYGNQSNYSNISVWTQDSNIQEVCFGIRTDIDMNLLSIFNKAIESISESDLQSIIYNNISHTMGKVTVKDFFLQYQREITILAFLIVSVIIVILGWSLIERTRMNHLMAMDNQRYEQLSEISNESVFEYDFKKDRLQLSEQGAKFLGFQRNEEHFAEHLTQSVKQGEKDKKDLLDCLISKSDDTKEFPYRLPDGTKRWIRLIRKTITNSAGEPLYVIGKTVDIQKEKDKQNIWKERAQKDSLTNIYNIASAKHIIIDYLSKERDVYGTLLMIDIDHFKYVNDQFGHFIGDKVLVEVAEVLQYVFRKEDVVARLGGDEFIVFIKALEDTDVVKKKCELVRHKIKEIDDLGEGNHVTVSIGAALTGNIRSYDELYQKADKALYQVKENGRDGYWIL